MSNWHFVRQNQSVELLVSVVMDFLRILDKKIFRNIEQIQILSQRIQQQIDGEIANDEALNQIASKPENQIKQYHIGLIIILSDFAFIINNHNLASDEAEKSILNQKQLETCKGLCDIILKQEQLTEKDKLASLMVQLGTQSDILST